MLTIVLCTRPLGMESDSRVVYLAQFKSCVLSVKVSVILFRQHQGVSMGHQMGLSAPRVRDRARKYYLSVCSWLAKKLI